MNDLLTTTANYLFSWTLITLILSWLLALCYPWFSQTLNNHRVEPTASYTLLYGLLAPIISTTTLTLLTLPALIHPLISSHCHGTTCTPHALHMTSDTTASIATVAIAIVLLMGLLIYMLMQLFSSRKQLQALDKLSQTGTTDYRVIETNDHIAWCAGLLTPRIYLSSGLINSMPHRQVKLILAHELMHAARKDNLRRWLLHWATIVWPKPIKTRIRQDLSDYHEKICDLATAKFDNGQLDRKELIQTLSTYNTGPNQSTGSSDNHSLQQRVASYDQAMWRELNPERMSWLKPLMCIASIWLGAVILALHFGHPILEWILQ